MRPHRGDLVDRRRGNLLDSCAIVGISGKSPMVGRNHARATGKPPLQVGATRLECGAASAQIARYVGYRSVRGAVRRFARASRVYATL